MAIASHAQTFTTLADFDWTNGPAPWSALVQGTDGNFYGTANPVEIDCPYTRCGRVFKINQAGKLTVVRSFDGTDGAYPTGLVLATDGNFYGTTVGGGVNLGCPNYGPGCGTVFKITPAGKLTTLYSFCSQGGKNCTDGAAPFAGLVQGTEGDLYGTTFGGGTGSACQGCGTVFKITPAGKLTTLYSFCSEGGANCTDGAWPYPGALSQSSNGIFYGTTSGGGTYGAGTIFKITAAGKLTTLYSFCPETNCTDGENPGAPLVQSTDGNFYGITPSGGANSSACWGSGCGTIFTITAEGKLTTLYSFCSQENCTDGALPEGLAFATDGNLYGTTLNGGTNSSGCNGLGCGTVFQVTATGTLTTLHSFAQPDGAGPFRGVLQATTGTFFGATAWGGTNCNGNCGTIYSLSMGLGPFVTFVQASGKVGWKAEILGQGFTGTTGVSFNGTPGVAFVVKSDTYLRATVPAGATTGPVTVTTPSGTLTSNVPYRVRPTILSFSPTSGPVGTQVTIMGVSLTQTTKVGFGGVPATQFTVNSDTQVTATVPSGAQTGKIAITTPGGKTWSTGVFTVTQ